MKGEKNEKKSKQNFEHDAYAGSQLHDGIRKRRYLHPQHHMTRQKQHLRNAETIYTTKANRQASAPSAESGLFSDWDMQDMI